MSVGVSIPLPAYWVDPGAMAQKAEELGFESFWCAEHPVMPVKTSSRFPGSEDGVIPEVYAHFVDPFVALARASGTTRRIKLATGIVLVPERLLADEHGRDYVVWELRGGRVCVAALGAPSSSPPPRGAAHVITQDSGARPYRDLVLQRRAGPYSLWRARPAPAGHGSCPAILVGGRANPARD